MAASPLAAAAVAAAGAGGAGAAALAAAVREGECNEAHVHPGQMCTMA